MLTIVWDIDDVLNDLMRSWFTQAWLPTHSGCLLAYSEITENPPVNVLGISRSEYLESLDVFRVSELAQRMQPNPHVLDWLQSYGSEYRHVALTARPLQSAPHAAEWLFRHFGAYMRTFGIVPTRLAASEPSYDRDKAEFLRWLGKADVLVDDSEENIIAAEKLGVCGVLYPQAWNGCRQTVQEVLQSITELAEAR
jgi:phosphoglycolate phosphatase-like HAD superfamily hydrolase